jgi:hypothetical protein
LLQDESPKTHSLDTAFDHYMQPLVRISCHRLRGDRLLPRSHLPIG